MPDRGVNRRSLDVVSAAYVIALAASVAAIVLARLTIDALPLRRVGVPVTRASAVGAGIGIVGLAMHCAAMFFPSAVGELPGTHGLIGEINALGAVSRIWYVAAAALVLIGLRRQHLIAQGIVALALVAVGVDGRRGRSAADHLTELRHAQRRIRRIARAMRSRYSSRVCT